MKLLDKIVNKIIYLIMIMYIITTLITTLIKMIIKMIIKIGDQMSMEDIFRNLNDIRVFDLFSSCMFNEEDALEIDEILEYLEYPDREFIQIEDSVKHLVEKGILSKTYVKEEVTSRFKTCSHTDYLKLPRLFSLKEYIPKHKEIIKIIKYYLNNDSKTGLYLTSAVLADSFRTAEQLDNNEGE